MELLEVLRDLVEEVPHRLRDISADRASRKPAPGKWSPKEELGHLLDSAANNHQRIVRIQLEGVSAMPGYAQEQWVALHRYQDRDWNELIELWRALNVQLLSAAEAAKTEHHVRSCSVGGSAPLTLSFIFDDYVRHMLHHLEHVGVNMEGLRLPPGVEARK